jgi:hypothetical protein
MPTAMHILSDDQAQQLSGGRIGSLLSKGTSRRSRSGFGSPFRCSFFAIRSILNNVSQINFAINLALNGGTVINNQTNVLSIFSRL